MSLCPSVIQCFSADVVESAEVASGRTTLGGYALGDLVNLGSGMQRWAIELEMQIADYYYKITKSPNKQNKIICY